MRASSEGASEGGTNRQGWRRLDARHEGPVVVVAGGNGDGSRDGSIGRLRTDVLLVRDLRTPRCDCAALRLSRPAAEAAADLATLAAMPGIHVALAAPAPEVLPLAAGERR